MNSFLQDFANKYLLELQHIPLYKTDPTDKVTVRKELQWFEEEDLEIAFQDAKEVVSDMLRDADEDCRWVLEKAEFADDVEKYIETCMAYGCICTIVNSELRDKKIKENPIFEGLFTEEDIDRYNSIADQYVSMMDTQCEGIILKAEQFPGKPKISPAQ